MRSKEQRARIARENGAKSKGPKTPEGLYRSRTASYKHGIYAAHNYVMPCESNTEFAELQKQMFAYWRPKSSGEELLVDELVGVLLQSRRIQAAKNDYLHDRFDTVLRNIPHCRDHAKLYLEAEKLSSVAGGSLDRFHARLARLARERQRIQRRLLSLQKQSRTSGPSHKLLKIHSQKNAERQAAEDAKAGDGAKTNSGSSTWPCAGLASPPRPVLLPVSPVNVASISSARLAAN